MRIGLPELIVVLVVVLLIFGAGKLPEVGTSLGKAMREFKAGLSDDSSRTAEPVDPAKSDKS